MKCEDDHEWWVVKNLEESIMAHFIVQPCICLEGLKRTIKLQLGLLNLVFKLWFILLNALKFLNSHHS
jgi:hypothetical protein